MADTIRVVTIDDDPSIRSLLRALLSHTEGFELVGEADDGGPATLELVEIEQPDVVLLDLDMPVADGYHALPELFRVAPRSMLLVLSVLPAEQDADALFRAGAFAYLEKSTLGREFCAHLRDLHTLFVRALGGETVWTPAGPERVRQ